MLENDIIGMHIYIYKALFLWCRNSKHIIFCSSQHCQFRLPQIFHSHPSYYGYKNKAKRK